ncbi:hypothetical protein Droror1_Dr00002312 [Drosera rotundifolia]
MTQFTTDISPNITSTLDTLIGSHNKHFISGSFVPLSNSTTRVGRQVVNIPSFIVRVDSQKHIDFSLTSPFGGGCHGRVKRKNLMAAAKKAVGGDGDEDEE